MIAESPLIATSIRHIRFDEFVDLRACSLSRSIAASCVNLRTLSITWMILKQSSEIDLLEILGCHRTPSVESLEIRCFEPKPRELATITANFEARPFTLQKGNFSHLKYLAILQETTCMPIDDRDLTVIAATATNLKELHVRSSCVSLDAVLALASASRGSLRRLDYIPHWDPTEPYTGPVDGEHLCARLHSLSRLTHFDISLPSICSIVFADLGVSWQGHGRFRAPRLCFGRNIGTHSSQLDAIELKALLAAARGIGPACKLGLLDWDAQIELDLAGYVFEPLEYCVSGFFELEMTDAADAGIDDWAFDTSAREASGQRPSLTGIDAFQGALKHECYRRIPEHMFFASSAMCL